MRIPLTGFQKDAIRAAAERAGMEMTAWARITLMAAAAEGDAFATTKQSKRKTR